MFSLILFITISETVVFYYFFRCLAMTRQKFMITMIISAADVFTCLYDRCGRCCIVRSTARYIWLMVLRKSDTIVSSWPYLIDGVNVDRYCAEMLFLIYISSQRKQTQFLFFSMHFIQFYSAQFNIKSPIKCQLSRMKLPSHPISWTRTNVWPSVSFFVTIWTIIVRWTVFRLIRRVSGWEILEIHHPE